MSERRYKFWLETEKGTYLAWDGLSEAEARKMYNVTQKRQSLINPDPVKRFGWEEERS